jgi:hypothetical protein
MVYSLTLKVVELYKLTDYFLLILTYVDYEKHLMFAVISSAVFLTRKSVIGMKTMYKFIKYYEHALGNQVNATNAWIFHLS